MRQYPLLCTGITLKPIGFLDSQIQLLGGRLVLVHEGGYSEVYVPFCGHAVIEELVGHGPHAADPFADTFALRQPGPGFQAVLDGWVDDMAAFHRARGCW